jgi:hypothetical protein
VAGRRWYEPPADNERERIRIVMDDDRTGWVLPEMVPEEGKWPALRRWCHPDLLRTTDEGLRMVVSDWGSALTPVMCVAGAMRSSQREPSITVLVPCLSDLEVGVREAADFFISKPCQVAQIRRVPALACGPRTKATGHVPKMPAGSA